MSAEFELKLAEEQIVILRETIAQLKTENERLREMLGEARKAIANVPDMSGFGIGGEGMTHWYLGDQLLNDIDALLENAQP